MAKSESFAFTTVRAPEGAPVVGFVTLHGLAKRAGCDRDVLFRLMEQDKLKPANFLHTTPGKVNLLFHAAQVEDVKTVLAKEREAKKK